MRIYFRSMGETIGPVNGTQLREKAVKGIVKPDTMVRVGDDGEWVRASRLMNLFDAEGRAIGPDSNASATNVDNLPKETGWTLKQPMVFLVGVVGVVLLLFLVWYLSTLA